MSAAKYIWASIHTEHLPGYVWPKSRHLCLSRALLLGWIPWRQKSSVKTSCPAKAFWSWDRGVDHNKETRGEEGWAELTMWADRLHLGARAWEAPDCLDEAGARGGDLSGTAETAGLSEDRCVGMGGTRTFWTGENCELTEVERKVVVLVCEEQGLLMAEFCGGDLVWTRPMTVSRLLLQPPCFLPSPDAGLPKDLKITDTNYTIMSFITAGKSLLICKLTTDGCCFKC